MSTSHQTHVHSTIKEWAEERNGVPARVKDTDRNGDQGILRIHFPDHSTSTELEEISWEDFFADFEKENLDFLYQEEKADGESSTFHKFVNRGQG